MTNTANRPFHACSASVAISLLSLLTPSPVNWVMAGVAAVLWGLSIFWFFRAGGK